MRDAVGQAKNSYNQAVNTSAGLGAQAQGIGANLTPFLTQEMLHPQGIGQQGLAAEEAAALGGAGGAASGIAGEAAQRAGASRNAGGYQAALSEAARQRDKAAAGASEGITAQNEQLKQQQAQQGASGLQGLYGVNTSGMLQSQGQEAKDIEAQVQAGNSGWLQNTMGILQGLGSAAGGAAGMGLKFK